MGRFVTYQTMTQKIAREILTDADFGWMSVDERKLFLAIHGIEKDAPHTCETLIWSVHPGLQHTIFMVTCLSDGGHGFLGASSLCKTWWKRWILKFLYLEWMP